LFKEDQTQFNPDLFSINIVGYFVKKTVRSNLFKPINIILYITLKTKLYIYIYIYIYAVKTLQQMLSPIVEILYYLIKLTKVCQKHLRQMNSKRIKFQNYFYFPKK
jgi:hypothetical protein